VKSYAWLKLSADANEATAFNLLPGVEKLLSPEQLVEGKRLSQEYKAALPAKSVKTE
jgi:hypothetical protein